MYLSDWDYEPHGIVNAVSPSMERMLLSVGYTMLAQHVVTTSDFPNGVRVVMLKYSPRPPCITQGPGPTPYATPVTYDYQTVNPADLGVSF